MGSKKRKVRVRGKKSKKKKEKKIKPYKKPRFCPKCGPGVHLAEHKEDGHVENADTTKRNREYHRASSLYRNTFSSSQ